MTEKDIFKQFRKLFPNFYKKIRNYEKDTSSSIIVNMDDGKSLEFLFYDSDHWTLKKV